MQVGRYRFLDRLAVGGMAEVFVAVAQGSEGFEKPVVLKRLLPELARMPRFQQMFLDEARIMLNLQHGNIVQILDMGRMEGVPFLTLEYVHGKDLRTILQRASEHGTRIPQALAAYIVGEVCRALDYAHRKTDDEGQPLHIVHRDINPANILVSHEGEVKVSDFGLAKARDNLEKSDADVIKGKLSYLSPEQAAGKPVDSRHDIFSLGTTLYEMVCDRRPFDGESDVAVVMKIVEASFPFPSEVVSELRPELEAVILRAMKKDPAERYQTAGQMREELSRFLQQLPSPPGDRELMDFVNALFPERRSNSSLFRLIPMTQLPPPMTSVSRTDGLSEFHQSLTPTPLLESLGPGAGGAVPPPTPGGLSSRAPPPPRTPPIRVVVEPPRTAAGVVSSSQGEPALGGAAAAPAGSGRWIVVMLLLVCAIGGVAFWLYTQRRSSELPVASLAVTSAPAGAQVFLDDVHTGQATPAVLQNLALHREYRVNVGLPNQVGGRPGQHFRFDRGGPHAYHFEIGPGKEALAVVSEPAGCDVLVDGELRGQAPLEVHLARGRKHAIELRKRGYRAKLVQHYAERDRDTLRLELEAEPPRTVKRVLPVRVPKPGSAAGETGTLEIRSDLRGEVFIDDRPVGRTPGFRRALAAGTYRVMVVPDGTKIRHAATIAVVAGKTHQLTLTPSPTP